MAHKASKNIPSVNIASPSWRYLEVLSFISSDNYSKRKAVPKTFSLGQESLLEAFRDPESTEGYPCRVALLLEKVPTARALLRGLLFSGCDVSSISEISSESEEVVYSYKELFFDTSVFRNTLLKIAYIRSLPQETENDKFEKQMLSWGHYLGCDYIAWKIGVNRAPRSPSESVQKILDDSSWRSSEHRMSSLVSDESKEARSWVPAVLRSAEMMRAIENSSGMENALSELKIKLEGDDNTISIKDLDAEIKG